MRFLIPLLVLVGCFDEGTEPPDILPTCSSVCVPSYLRICDDSDMTCYCQLINSSWTKCYNDQTD